MSLRFNIPLSVVLACLITALAMNAAVVRGDDAHGHPMPAEDATASHDHPDYNKAPLPGSAPGLGTLFVFSLVLFTAFVFAARSLVWAPLIVALDQREARVNQAHADATAAKVEAEQLLAQHNARMAEVQEQVQGIVAQARKEAEQEKSRIIAEAEAQAKNLREQAVAEIESARDAALGQLNQSLDGEIARAVEQVVGYAV